MKSRVLLSFLTVLAGLAIVANPAIAQQTVTESLNILDEKLGHLQSEVDDLQFKQQQMQQDIAKAQADIKAAQSAPGGASSSDLQALQARIDALDAARQKDKQAIIDQLAKELASISAGHPAPKTSGTPSAAPAEAQGNEHVVTKGESLSSIAKTYGITVDDLKKANNITNPNKLEVGQKLVIPTK
jgi:LysM repeat protein